MEKFLIFDCNKQYLNLNKLNQSIKNKIKLILHRGIGETLNHWSNSSATSSILKPNEVYWVKWNPTSTGVLIDNINNSNILNVDFSNNEGVSTKPDVGDVIWIQEDQNLISEVSGKPIIVNSISESNQLTITETLTLEAGTKFIFYTPNLIEDLKSIEDYCNQESNTCKFIECGGSVEYANCGTNYFLDCKLCECINIINSESPPHVVLADPYFNNVSLLLHMDGKNNSNVFEDSSLNNITILSYPRSVSNPTNEYQVKLKSQVKKFGNSSAYFSSDHSYLGAYMASGAPPFVFGKENFTVEMWIYPMISNIAQGIFSIDTGSTGVCVRYSQYNSLIIGGLVYNWDPLNNLKINTWNHIALVRSSGILKMFVDGVNKLNNPTNDSDLVDKGRVLIGASPSSFQMVAGQVTVYLDSDSFKGYIDELRITKGVARYVSDFTPSTQSFPNFTN